MRERRELMLIFAADPSAVDSRGRYHVTQRVSSRVVIVEPAEDVTKEDLRAANRVAAVLEQGESLAFEVRETLTETEALFVAAYSARSPKSEKKRLGDGLTWDAEGFLPPDPPSKQ